MENRPKAQPIAAFLENRLTAEIGFPLVFLFLWASGFSVAQIGLRYAEPLTFLALRYGCLIVLLLPLQLILKLPLPRSKKGWWDLCVIGFLIQFVYFSGIYLALKAGLSAGALALIVSMQPILVGIVSPLSVGERISSRQWSGMLLGFAGAAVVIISKSSVTALSPKGMLFAGAALIGMTSGVLYEKKTGSSQHPIVATLVQCSVGFVLTTPLAMLLEHGHLEWTAPMVGALAYLVICNSLIAITLLLHMVRHRQAARVSSLFFLVPPMAAVMAKLLVGETMPPVAWAGMAAATAGVWVANLRRP